MIVVRMARIAGSLAVAILVTPLVVLGSCVSEADRTASWAAVRILLAASAILWIGGLSVTAVVNRLRGQSVNLWQCLALSGICGLIVPTFGIALARLVAPWFVESTGKSTEFPLHESLVGGLFVLPSALLSGWFLWRGGFPEAANDQRSTTARSTNELRGKALVFGLAAIPILPAAVFFIGCLAFLFDGRRDNVPVEVTLSPEQTLMLGAWIFVAAEAWSVLGGFVLLHAFTRQGRLLDRTTCVAVGACIALLLPFAAVVIGSAVGRLHEPLMRVTMLFASEPPIQNAALYAIAGGLLLPFGAPGGWVLWHVAVRPAPLPLPSNTATVFD